MRATVFFITLDDFQSAEVNAKGWGGSVAGRAYMEATCKANPVPALAWGMYQPAASGDFESADDAFRMLQNLETSWRWRWEHLIHCHTNRPRSMMVGDLVRWDDGRIEVCDHGSGWKEWRA